MRCYPVQARLTLADGSVVAAQVSPAEFTRDIAERAEAGRPLLDFYFHSHSADDATETFHLTVVPPLTVPGAADLTIVGCEGADGGEQVAGSPLQVMVEAGALVTAALTAPASASAGDDVVLAVTGFVRPLREPDHLTARNCER